MEIQRDSGFLEDIPDSIEKRALPSLHALQIVALQITVLPFELVGPIFRGAESAP